MANSDFDWTECQQRFTNAEVDELARERGVQSLTIERWRQHGWIGRCYAKKWHVWCFAFPVGDNGTIYRAHCRGPERDRNGKWPWAYEPLKDSRPVVPAFVQGDPAKAAKIFIDESQWDGLSLTDKLPDLIGEIDEGKVAIVSTRGAKFGDRLKVLTWAANAKVYLLAQNDQPGQEWVVEVLASVNQGYVIEIPATYKDLGQWCKDGGATVADIEAAIAAAKLQQAVPSQPDPVQETLDKLEAAALTSKQFESVTIPPYQKLLGDWLREGDLGFIFGVRGEGKTWFLDAIATAVSTGQALDTWKVPLAFSVVLFDGEMPADQARDRLKGLAAGNQNLTIIHHEWLFEKTGLVINLADRATQQAILRFCLANKTKLLMLDNLSCLASGIAENDADAWDILKSWLLELRRHRIAVVIVHHAGVAGDRMRGTTKREDPAAWVIQVKRLDSENQPGIKFETSFTKLSRNTQEHEWARKWHFKTEYNGQVTYSCEEISSDAKVLQLIQDSDSDGISCTELAKELNCSLSPVSKAAKRLLTQKLIEKRRRRYYARGFMK